MRLCQDWSVHSARLIVLVGKNNCLVVGSTVLPDELDYRSSPQQEKYRQVPHQADVLCRAADSEALCNFT